MALNKNYKSHYEQRTWKEEKKREEKRGEERRREEKSTHPDTLIFPKLVQRDPDLL